MKNTEKTMEKIVALCKGRGFIFSGSEIYQSSITLSARNRSLHSLQSIRGSEKPPTWPEATHTWGFIKMAASSPTL